MTITVGETNFEVTVNAYTTLRVEGVTFEVRGRAARITEAEVYWRFEEAAWLINFVQVTGVYVNKDGRESKQRLDETTHPGDERAHRIATPSDILAAALAHTPAWTPEVSLTKPLRRPRHTHLTGWRRSRRTADPQTGTDAAADDLRQLRQIASPQVRVTHVETRSQVLVHAYAALQLEAFTMRVKTHTARIKKAKIHWDYQDGAWVVGAVNVWGPVIRKSDGAESTQHVDELTRPASASNAQYGVITPPEILEVALRNTPDVEPRVNATSYPRHAGLRSSL
jgi:hypothetical protein